MNNDDTHEINSTRQRKLDTLFTDQPYVAAPLRTATLDEPRPYFTDRTVGRPDSLINDDVLRQLIEGRNTMATGSPSELHDESWWLDSIATAPSAAVDAHSAVWTDEIRRAETAPQMVQLQQLDVFTIQEAAQYLRLGEGTIRALVRRDEVPYARIGRRILFRRVALLDWLAARERHGA